ncbi:MAG: Hsp20/alpha crystallin family protein [Calditrichaceae bacterium]
MNRLRLNSIGNFISPSLNDGNILSDFFGTEVGDLRFQDFKPPVNVLENDDAFIMTFEIPGVEKKDVNITFKNDVLTVNGEKKINSKANRAVFHQFERKNGKFQRAFYINEKIDPERIDATFSAGVLTIELSKAEEVKPKEIKIN